MSLFQEIELSEIDCRFASLRQHNSKKEQRLLHSISEQGVTTPLLITCSDDKKILLDGFKRYRCCKKLSQSIVPITIIGTTDVLGICSFLTRHLGSKVNILEESCFIDELVSSHSLTINEVAHRLHRSVSWVRLRQDLVHDMSDTVREAILSGSFPIRSYLYDLRKVTRVPSQKSSVDTFVTAVKGNGLSTRDISVLSAAYFSGTEKMREQIKTGNLSWTLKMVNHKKNEPRLPLLADSVTTFLCTIERYVNQIATFSDRKKQKQCIQSLTEELTKVSTKIKEYHDKIREATDNS